MPKTLKRVLKIIIGAILFLTLPSLLFFGVIYFKYNEPLPDGTSGAEADALANQMLQSLNVDAYNKTKIITWSFKGIHHYKWYKNEHKCEVSWKHFKVNLDLKHPSNSEVFVVNNLYNGIEKQKYITKATSYFNNDSFWLVAPYKIFDKGTVRKIVNTNGNKKALLVTYTKGGDTPGDSYLWYLDAKTKKPSHFKMWVDILPIGGLEASWNQWKTSKSGAVLPTNHKLLFFNLDMTPITTQ